MPLRISRFIINLDLRGLRHSAKGTSVFVNEFVGAERDTQG